MTDLQFKTLQDGTIDYGYYKQRGRRMHGETVRAFFASIGKVVGSLAAHLIGRAAPKPLTKALR